MMEAVEIAFLDEAEWAADEVSFCTTSNSSMCVELTEE